MHPSLGRETITGRSVPRAPAETRLLLASASAQFVTPLQQRLVAQGYNVTVARSGAEVRTLAYEARPHVLLLDAALPDESARDLCRGLKADASLGYLPVVLLGDDDAWDIDADLDEDVALPWPVDDHELYYWLRFLLRVRRQFDRSLTGSEALLAESRQVELVKQQIINTVHHELRTPLLLMKSSLIVHGVDLEPGERAEPTSFAAVAAKAIAQLEGVVDNISQLAATGPATLVPTIITEAVDLAQRYLARSWRWHGHVERLQRQVDPDLPPVLGDKRVVARLLQLFLDNALKFSPPDARVEVHIRRVPEGVWIAVRDYGIGIPHEQQARIFNSFYQVDGSTSRRYGGTGTGLALAQLLAQNLHTRIEVESAPHAGSVFSFVLPEVDLSAL